VKLLLSKGAELNLEDNPPQTARGSARMKGQTEIIELLKQAGAKESLLPRIV
jgi:hypothetical protein